MASVTEPSSLPKAEEYFDGLLQGKNLRERSREERFRVKERITTLVATTGINCNAILDHYGINRTLYFNHIDPLTEATTKETNGKESKKRSEKRKYYFTKGMNAGELLALYERAEKFRREEGMTVEEACETAGIYPSQYYKWQLQLSTLRTESKKLAIEGKKVETPRAIRQLESTEIRTRVFDAIVVLSIATRRDISDVSRDFGVRHFELKKWQEIKDVEPIFPNGTDRRRKLQKHDLHLSTENKIRLTRALEYIEQQHIDTRENVSALLGFQQQTTEDWTKITIKVTQMARKKRKEKTNVLSLSEMNELMLGTGQPRKLLDTWIRTFGLRDIYSQLALSPTMKKNIELEPEALVSLWADMNDPQKRHHAESVLMEYYEPLVLRHARSQRSKVPDSVDEDGLYNDARKGLSDVLKKYDPSRNTKFETFAAMRISGEMKDGMRRADWVPRTVRQAQNKVKGCNERYQKAYGRNATVQDLAEEFGISLAAAKDLMHLAVVRQAQSIDVHADDENEYGPDEIVSGRSESDGARLRQEDRDDVTRALLTGLSPEMTRIVVGYYYEGKTMKQIGDELGLSESRVSQMHTELIPFLKKKIMAHAGEKGTLGFLASAFGNQEYA